jgi:hypothetical protein
VFIVPMMSRFAGTAAFAGLRLAKPNSSPESGSVTLTPKAHGVNLVNHQRVRV